MEGVILAAAAVYPTNWACLQVGLVHAPQDIGLQILRCKQVPSQLALFSLWATVTVSHTHGLVQDYHVKWAQEVLCACSILCAHALFCTGSPSSILGACQRLHKPIIILNAPSTYLLQHHLHHTLWQVSLHQGIQGWQVRELADDRLQSTAALGAQVFTAATVRLQWYQCGQHTCVTYSLHRRTVAIGRKILHSGTGLARQGWWCASFHASFRRHVQDACAIVVVSRGRIWNSELRLFVINCSHELASPCHICLSQHLRPWSHVLVTEMEINARVSGH